ncbi:MAG: ABC transporter ATP-binding protein [Chloroflexi bacterium]|nr:ABC transporter ATP-binding protein [Chloroflexota bacterium]
MLATILHAEGLVKRFPVRDGYVQALAGVDLVVRRGEFVAIMGSSGSGKSTLLHLLGGLERPSAGRVLLDGMDLGRLSDRELTLLRRRKIGFVFQFFNLIPTLTAHENIILPLLIDGKRPAEQARMLELLVRLLRLEGVLDHRPDQLSGGEQQRVAIARALLTQPDVIMADEPTGNLDHASGMELLEHLWSSCAHLGRTIVMVTHEAKAAIFADRVVLLQDGLVIDQVPLGRDKPRDNARPLIARLQELGL